ncbi:MAG TPA: methyltransferase domain-containing protein [Nitrososphaeraceae archaeon]
MSEAWNKVYKSDNSFFGDEPSNFALLCFNHMKANNVKKILELGAGHGRDTIFFASNGIEVDALDYSSVAIDILNKIAKEKQLLIIKSQTFDVRNPLPFADGYFDAVYSHMLFNMHFSEEELHFIFSQIRRVLKPEGLNFFSVRNHHDKSYRKGKEVAKGIYDIDGFQIRFFTEKKIQDLTSAEGFEILWIKEEYEEPVIVYLVSSIRKNEEAEAAIVASLSIRDVLPLIAKTNDGRPIKDLGSPLISVNKNTDIRTAIDFMIKEGIRNIGIKENDKNNDTNKTNLIRIINDRKILEFLLSHNGREIMHRNGVGGLEHVDIINHLDMISARKVKYDTIVNKASELLIDIRNPFLILREEEEIKRDNFIITPWDLVMKILNADHSLVGKDDRSNQKHF